MKTPIKKLDIKPKDEADPMSTIAIDLITAYTNSDLKCWRFVHDGVKVLANPFNTTGKTMTINTLVCFDTFEECDAEIARLHLAYTPDPN
jgi:hypothetical protein